MSDSAPADRETITVFSDYVCPFCYLGRHSLRQYQAIREEPLEIDWHPFDLRSRKRRPDGTLDHSAADGKDDAYYQQAKQNVRRLQEEYGVDMELEIAMEIDSLPAQVVSAHVRETHDYGTWIAFDWAVFEALWIEGRDIGDADVLAAFAEEVGIDSDEVRLALTDGDLRERLRDQFEAAHERGVTGVPTFAYGGYSARGAVPPAQLRRLVEGLE